MTEEFFKHKSSYDYYLPDELIAQTPIEPRDASRLLICTRDGKLCDGVFTDIADLLSEGDVLVINKSKVLPARLYGRKEGTGALCEIVLLERENTSGERWQAIVRPGRRLKPGTRVEISELLTATVEDILDDGKRIVSFEFDKKAHNFYEILDTVGNMPLPPYIKEKLEDKSRYQTVYATSLGSAAAPTAGLHFTSALLKKLEDKGIKIAPVTLHVGLGTFRPVKEDNIEKHIMHSEFYTVPAETAKLINKAKSMGKKVVAVGTTSCRTLEGSYAKCGEVREDSGYTDIFIYPGKKLNVIDSLITNFHLPESTLIMLVCAIYGYENTMRAYEHAVNKKYRFFSFGDAMFIQ